MGKDGEGAISSAFYEKVLRVCERYSGNDAKGFLDRQVRHINKDPDTLSPESKAELAKWCEISGTLLLGQEGAKKARPRDPPHLIF